MKKPNIINFHITDACNYTCKHCFADFKMKDLPLKDAKKVIDSIEMFFRENEIDNGRINIAGGEPLMYRHLDEIIDYIAEKNIKVSIITNGSRLTEERIAAWSGKVAMIGISVDAINADANIHIGRCDALKTTNELPPLALVPVFTWMLVFFTWRYVSVEYEYSITSGELTFSKIFGNRSRRTVLKLMLRDAIKIAPLDNEFEAKKAGEYLPEREFWAISAQNAPDVYFILFEYDTGKGGEKQRAVFYFEATQKALQVCRFYNPSATVVTKVSR